MAEEKKTEKEAGVSYNVPLRKSWQKAPPYKRAKKAIVGLKEFLFRHTKADNVKIGKHLNEEIWKDGMKNPPHHVKVHSIKEDNIALVELEGKEYEKPKAKEEKKEGGLKGMVKGMTGGKKEPSAKDKRVEAKKEAKVEEKPDAEPAATVPKEGTKPVEKPAEPAPKQEAKPVEKPAEPAKSATKPEPKAEPKPEAKKE